MPRVTFVDSDQVSTTTYVDSGTSVMDASMEAGLDGIRADCGGNLMCATCHVYVDSEWLGILGEREPEEEMLLDETTSPRQPLSRLSCQLIITDELDGITVRFPAEQ
jgi:2Fe-2S ferredoxin